MVDTATACHLIMDLDEIIIALLFPTYLSNLFVESSRVAVRGTSNAVENDVSKIFCAVFPWARKWCECLDRAGDMEKVCVMKFLTQKENIRVGICCKVAHEFMTDLDGLDETGTNNLDSHSDLEYLESE